MVLLDGVTVDTTPAAGTEVHRGGSLDVHQLRGFQIISANLGGGNIQIQVSFDDVTWAPAVRQNGITDIGAITVEKFVMSYIRAPLVRAIFNGSAGASATTVLMH